jgi:hypothetical protein
LVVGSLAQLALNGLEFQFSATLWADDLVEARFQVKRTTQCLKSTMTHNSVSGHDTNPRLRCVRESGHKGPHRYELQFSDNAGNPIGEVKEYKYKLPRSRF